MSGVEGQYGSPVHGAAATGEQGAYHSGGVTSGSGSADVNGKDRDPAPFYDGTEPETSFQIYEKNVKLWQYETDVPQRKQGVKLMRSLGGVARLAVEDMDFESIACDDGAKNVLNRLREYFKPHLEVSLPRAFEAAVYGACRSHKESFAEYVP